MSSLQFILYKIFVNIIGIGVSAFLFRHVEIESFNALFLSGLVLSIMNFLVKPFLILITLPIQVLTLGLFYFFINAVIILLVSSIVKGFHVDGLWTAVGVSIIVSVINLIFDIFFNTPNINITFWRF